MAQFKTTLHNCQQCGRRIMVRPADAERGSIVCSHVGCGALNIFQTAFHYDQSLAESLPVHGQLIHMSNASPVILPVRLGENVIGTDPSCQIQVDRFLHDGRCYISRRHCTLTVTFDKWLGTLRYQLQDGAIDPLGKVKKPSLNGTSLNNAPLHNTECVDVSDGGLITLGGIDQFRLVHQVIDPVMRNTYRIDVPFNADQTQ